MTGAICRSRRLKQRRWALLVGEWLATRGWEALADEAHTAEVQIVWKEEDGNIEGAKDAIAARSWQLSQGLRPVVELDPDDRKFAVDVVISANGRFG